MVTKILALLAFPFALVGTIVTILGVSRHLNNYTTIQQQRYVVRILLMVPVYCWTAFFSLLFHNAARSLDVLRDCYEAFILVCFFLLMVNKLNGEAHVILLLKDKQRNMRYCICCTKMKFQELPDQVYARIKKGILQFALFMPLLTIAILVLDLLSFLSYNSFSFLGLNLYIQLAATASVLASLICLLQFYRIIVEDVPPEFRLFAKFVCLKIVIFLSFIQSIVIGLIFYTFDGEPTNEDDTLDGEDLQHILVIVEMSLLSFVHLSVFGSHEYVTEQKLATRLRWQAAARDALFLGDFINDLKKTFSRISPVESEKDDLLEVELELDEENDNLFCQVKSSDIDPVLTKRIKSVHLSEEVVILDSGKQVPTENNQTPSNYGAIDEK
eukprot:Lithocolla_globosa_v1_NODE_1297_length_2693_cov_35.857468.p1 type:complete len:385 gc:universal NODE_1297_length_2693_cov_35.857468:1363-2517(+)